MRTSLTGRSEIRLDTHAYRVNKEALAALARCDGLYQFGNELAMVGEQNYGGERMPTVVPVARDVLFSRLSEVAEFIGERGRPEHAPPWVLGYLESCPKRPGIKDIVGVVEYPVMREDGSALQAPGYDSKTHLYYSPPEGLRVPPVPENPTENDVCAARERLLDLVVDFPWASSAHRSAWLASLLTFFARYAYTRGGTPLFLIDKNVPGAGSGLLANITAKIPTGRVMPTQGLPADSTASGKLITSICVAGQVVLCLDNIATPLGDDKLDLALTSRLWVDRILGVTKLVVVPHRVIWFATGNNVQFNAKADTSRRTQHIRMISLEEDPEKRVGFKHADLEAFVDAHRGQLICDCLTLLRAGFLNRSSLPAMPRWGSFEQWSEWVRGAIVNAGLPDPYETHEALSVVADTAKHSLRNFIRGWEELLKENKVESCTVREALGWLAEDSEVKADRPGHQLRFVPLRDALAECCRCVGNSLPDTKQVGYALRRFKGRVWAGKRLVPTDERGEDGNKWTVEAISSAPVSG